MMLTQSCINFLATTLVMLFATVGTIQAKFTFNVYQNGTSVEIDGVGSINLSALSYNGAGVGNQAGIQPGEAFLEGGPYSLSTPTSSYTGISGPAGFGSGQYRYSASGSGDAVGVTIGTTLTVPTGYVSGAFLSDSDLIFNQTLAYIGATAGSYVYTWGSGPTADSLTINIGTPVPEPASLAMIAVPLGVAQLRRRRGRRLS